MVFASSDVGIETIAVLGFDAMKLLYLLDDRYQKGMEEGMEKGRAEGKEEGRAEGIEEGMNLRSLEIARKMLAKGMDEASIMDMTGLTAEEIKLLKAEM